MNNSWDAYFMTLAYCAATRSKDKSTTLGAVIVTDDNLVIATGYNSFPRDINDNDLKRQERPAKYLYFEHAERNAIYSAVRHGISTRGCRMYTQGQPCADCARAVIQAGIKEVISHDEWECKTRMNETWNDNRKAGQEMMDEAGIKTRRWFGKLLAVPVIPILQGGKRIKFDSDGELLGLVDL
jgi:dCMP deaminase